MTPQLNAVQPGPPAQPQPTAHYPVDNWEYRVPMSTREVATPGNRPGLFLGLYERAKLARQPDFYDPYFPLRYLEVPKCK